MHFKKNDPPSLKKVELKVISDMALKITGLHINPTDHSVIYQNVINRMLNYGSPSLDHYLKLVENSDEELQQLISALTIHTTSWFREPKSFDAIASFFRSTPQAQKVLKVLSIACSTGEEVYSLAAVLDVLKKENLISDFTIEGWDIDPISLRSARLGQYHIDSQQSIPSIYRHIIQKDSHGKSAFLVNSAIKSKCFFRTVNIFLPPMTGTLPQNGFDAIFCRNLLIYFSPEQVQSVLDFCMNNLASHGLICLGSSETSALAKYPVTRLGGSLFRSEIDRIQPHSTLATSSLPTKKAALNILIIEDDLDLLDILVDGIGLMGHFVRGTSHPHKALQMLLKDDISLVISDYRLSSTIDGLELLQKARKQGYRGHFIMITGMATVELATQCTLFDCHDVIQKPIELDEILKIMDRITPNKKQTLPNIQKANLVLLGASTGGPEELVSILKDMPLNCPPVIVVQHIEAKFSRDFALRLSKLSGLTLGKMVDNERIQNGHLYMAQGDYHLGLRQLGDEFYLRLSTEPKVHNSRPSVDYLFKSIKKADVGIFAALLTGMGRDGAEGLLELKKLGAQTFAQDEASSVVFGMPKVAISLGAAQWIMNPQEIRESLLQAIK